LQDVARGLPARLLMVSAPGGGAPNLPPAPPVRRDEEESMVARRYFGWLALLLVFPVGALAGYGAKALMHWVSTPAIVEFADRSALLERTDAELLLFSVSTCPYCRKAREWLTANSVPFKEMMVDESVEAQKLFDELDESGVPVLVLRDRVIRGFVTKEYAEALAKN
jgi:glutaredoxin 3